MWQLGNLKINRDVSLASFSTFKIGGRAEYFFKTSNPEGLIKAIEWVKKNQIPYKIFAGGSNVLISDGKLKGLFIRFFGGKVELLNQKVFLAEAGVSLGKIVKKSIKLGLQGLETFSGIPGTVGGAIIGNAGAYGHSISEIVDKVEIWDGKERRWLKNSECCFSYRESIFKKRPYFLLRAILKFKNGDRNFLKKRSKEIIKIRSKKYSSKISCPGSFFKNVPVQNVSKKSRTLIDSSKILEGKIPAGYLLEEVGAKGMRVGRIQVAGHHGNLIMNKGGGTAKDVKKLAKILKRRVKNKFGIELEEEIRYF